MSSTLQRCVLFLGLCLAFPISAMADATEQTAETLTWHHSSRDVYWNGELRSDVEVLSAEGSRWAVAVPSESKVLVLQPNGREDDDAGKYSVTELASSAFQWSASRLEATSAVPEVRDDARLFDFPDGVWIHWTLADEPQHLVLAPHQGSSGSQSLEQLWKSVPVWKSAQDAYEPTMAAVDRLRAEDRELRLRVFFGTWCGDSRRSVPRLLSALGAADNPNLEVELVAIGRGFTEPMDEIRKHRITNVPTVVVFEGENELGRFVERPHSDNVESDLAAILDGRPIPPRELFSDTDVSVAAGIYGFFRGQNRVGEERWHLFKTEDGDFRLHTRQWLDGRRTDTWHRRAAEAGSAFVEITRTADGQLSRTRVSFKDGMVSSTTRGSEGGIIRQTASLDHDLGDRALVIAPSVGGWGFVWADAGRPKARLETRGFALPGAGEPTAGRDEALALDWLGTEDDCESVAVRLGSTTGSLCLHKDLDVPTRATWNELDARLETLTVEPALESDNDTLVLAQVGE